MNIKAKLDKLGEVLCRSYWKGTAAGIFFGWGTNCMLLGSPRWGVVFLFLGWMSLRDARQIWESEKENQLCC